MTQLEIATQIFCSGRADNIQQAWYDAFELLELSKETNFNPEDKPIGLNPPDIEALEERTRLRTQQVIDLGFEYVDERGRFEKGINCVNPESIEKYDENDWEFMLGSFIGLTELPSDFVATETIKVISNANVVDFTLTVVDDETDFFKGNTYIEFEMPNTKLRLYKLDNHLQSEEDLQTTNKLVSKYILSSGENKEFDLGITIFKK